MESLYFCLNDFNSLLQCSICDGYLVEPYTIKECMHTFCRTCILLYLEKTSPSDWKCPKCHVQLPPSSDLSKLVLPDRQLTDVIGALLPSLELDELNNQKNFYQTNSISLPKDVRLKFRLFPQLTPMRCVDEHGQTKLRTKTPSIQLTSSDCSTNPVALQIELCEKDRNSSVKLDRRPRKYLCLNSQLTIAHLEKYIETVCQLTSNHEISIFFYDSCLSKETPLLMIKNLLFPSTDRMKLYFSILLNE